MINNNKGTTSTSGGALSTFDYSGYAARFITAQELNSACGITIGNAQQLELNGCKYLLQNTKYSDSSVTSSGSWLETPASTSSSYVWRIYGYSNAVNSSTASGSGTVGARPVIEVSKSKISY